LPSEKKTTRSRVERRYAEANVRSGIERLPLIPTESICLPASSKRFRTLQAIVGPTGSSGLRTQPIVHVLPVGVSAMCWGVYGHTLASSFEPPPGAMRLMKLAGLPSLSVV